MSQNNPFGQTKEFESAFISAVKVFVQELAGNCFMAGFREGYQQCKEMSEKMEGIISRHGRTEEGKAAAMNLLEQLRDAAKENQND